MSTRLACFPLLLVLSGASAAQSVQYRSPEGIEFQSSADASGDVARARAAFEADPTNIPRAVALGTAQAGIRQMREAILTFTTALRAHPNSSLLYRWRGHRHLSVREFDKAEADLTRSIALDSTMYGAWFHLGIVRFVRGEFSAAAQAFARAQPFAPDPGELKGSTDWLWMSLSRAGRRAEADAMLARRPDSLALDPEYGYAKRVRLYRGELTPGTLFAPSDTADTQVATLSYGLGNWHMVRGDTAGARRAFERATASGGWPAFGFIAAEAELRRLRGRS